MAKSWKRINGGVIVDGDGLELKDILKNLEGSMSGGRIIQGRSMSRQNSLMLNDSRDSPLGALSREDSQQSLGMSGLDVEDEDEGIKDPRHWMKVINAFEQPRLLYNVTKKHFDKDPAKPSLLPSASGKTQVFRNRYNLIHQRLLRNESFQARSFEPVRIPSLHRTSSTLVTTQQSYRLTPIANLLGRNGTNHLLLGLLTIAPTGQLAINDLTGSISLDLSRAKMVPEDGAWLAPGMIVLVDGLYEEEDDTGSGGMGNFGGIGGTIGGRFIGFTVGGPPCERRKVTLGLSGSNEHGDITAGGGFGWVDFLGVGSERAVGSKMAAIEKRVVAGLPKTDSGGGRTRMIVIGEVTLDNPRTLQALRKIFTHYAAEPEDTTPITFALMGNFVQHAIMARGASGGSIEYKEYFDELAALLSDFPTLLQASAFVFVPGDKDAWMSSFSAGAATPLPRRAVPDMFTSRIKRAFMAANAEKEKGGKKGDGEAVWTTNPARISVFGPAHEVVLFRDDITGRFRRSALRLKKDEPAPAQDAVMSGALNNDNSEVDPIQDEGAMDIDHKEPPPPTEIPTDILAARKLTKTLLDQGYLSPFPLASRPVLWDYASSLSLYPLPTALVVCDTEAPPFCVTYEGCHVMNPGSVVAPGRGGRGGLGRWVEFDVSRGVGAVKEALF